MRGKPIVVVQRPLDRAGKAAATEVFDFAVATANPFGEPNPTALKDELQLNESRLIAFDSSAPHTPLPPP